MKKIFKNLISRKNLIINSIFIYTILTFSSIQYLDVVSQGKNIELDIIKNESYESKNRESAISSTTENINDIPLINPTNNESDIPKKFDKVDHIPKKEPQINLNNNQTLDTIQEKDNPSITNPTDNNKSSDTTIESEFIKLPSPKQISLLELEIFNLVNQEREKLGEKNLIKNPLIKQAAKIRSKETGINKHNRPDGQNYHTIFNQVGYKMNHNFSSGENIATFSKTSFQPTDTEMLRVAKMIFDSWTKSPSHYKNIFDKRFKGTGIGVYVKIAKNKQGKESILIEAVQLFSTEI